MWFWGASVWGFQGSLPCERGVAAAGPTACRRAYSGSSASLLAERIKLDLHPIARHHSLCASLLERTFNMLRCSLMVNSFRSETKRESYSRWFYLLLFFLRKSETFTFENRTVSSFLLPPNPIRSPEHFNFHLFYFD